MASECSDINTIWDLSYVTVLVEKNLIKVQFSKNLTQVISTFRIQQKKLSPVGFKKIY